MSEQETPIEKAVRLLGGHVEAGKKLGCNPSFISQMTGGDRPVPPKRAAQIEELTGGQVTRQQLCPDFPWQTTAA